MGIPLPPPPDEENEGAAPTIVSSHLNINFEARPGYGGVITFSGTRANQAVYWSLLGYNSETQEYGVAYGSLRYSKTRTNFSSQSANIYQAPLEYPGENLYDVITVRWND